MGVPHNLHKLASVSVDATVTSFQQEEIYISEAFPRMQITSPPDRSGAFAELPDRSQAGVRRLIE
jgi:hypothetical protein